MKPDFSVQVDDVRSLVEIRMSGFFEPSDIARFTAVRDVAHQRLRCGPNEHVTLVDIREMDIQSQDCVARFQAVLSNPAVHSRRLAFVVGRSLARTQIGRAAQGRSAQFFDNMEAARNWLLCPGQAVA